MSHCAWVAGGRAGDAQGQYKGVLDCFAKTLRNDGLAAFYSGFLPNVSSISLRKGAELAEDTVVFLCLFCLTVGLECAVNADGGCLVRRSLLDWVPGTFACSLH